MSAKKSDKVGPTLDVLALHLPTKPWSQAKDRLLGKIKQAQEMFRQGGRVVSSTIIKSFILAAAITCCGMSNAVGQEVGKVAILDVAKVFKENPLFDAKVKAIMSEADQLKTQIAAEQERIKAEVLKLRELPAGEERDRREAQLEQQHTSLRTKTRQTESQLLNREARVYFDTYEEMKRVVESLAQQYNLSLVLRFDSEEVDPNDRNEVIKGVNRAVVFSRRIDLTNFVIEELNKRTAAAGSSELR